MIVQIVPAQLILELIDCGVFVDEQEFHAGHLGKVAQMLRGDRIAETGVMRATAEKGEEAFHESGYDPDGGPGVPADHLLYLYRNDEQPGSHAAVHAKGY